MLRRDGLVERLVVRADGSGQVGHAGSALLAGVADWVGLAGALSAAMAPTRERRSVHDPGVVLRDLVVVLAGGGDCLADLGALRDQLELFGVMASDATAFGVIDSVEAQCLERLREAVTAARARGWQLGARPQRRERQSKRRESTVIDVDATLTSAHSDKEQAAGNFKGGSGHHPLLCCLDISDSCAPGGACAEQMKMLLRGWRRRRVAVAIPSAVLVDVGSAWRHRARLSVGREGLGRPELLP